MSGPRSSVADPFIPQHEVEDLVTFMESVGFVSSSIAVTERELHEPDEDLLFVQYRVFLGKDLLY